MLKKMKMFLTGLAAATVLPAVPLTGVGGSGGKAGQMPEATREKTAPPPEVPDAKAAGGQTPPEAQSEKIPAAGAPEPPAGNIYIKEGLSRKVEGESPRADVPRTNTYINKEGLPHEGGPAKISPDAAPRNAGLKESAAGTAGPEKPEIPSPERTGQKSSPEAEASNTSEAGKAPSADSAKTPSANSAESPPAASPSRLETAYREAVGKYRALLAGTHPEVLPEMITGDTIEEADASLARALDLIGRVRKSLEDQAAAARVPAGAPPRVRPDSGSLSSREKIARGINF